MEPGPVTKRNKTTSKNFDNDFILENCDVIVIFLIYGQFGAIRKPGYGRRGCKTYVFINSNLKINSKKSVTQLSHYYFE